MPDDEDGAFAERDPVGRDATDEAGDPSGHPPLEIAAGTVGRALLGVLLVGFGLTYAHSVPQLLFVLIGLPAIFVGVIAQWRLPTYTSRLPVGVQAVLFAAVAAVSINAGFLDEGFNPLGLVWVLSLPAFPDLLPGRVRRWLRQSARP